MDSLVRQCVYLNSKHTGNTINLLFSTDTVNTQLGTSVHKQEQNGICESIQPPCRSERLFEHQGLGKQTGATSNYAVHFFSGYFVLNQSILPTNKVNTRKFS